MAARDLWLAGCFLLVLGLFVFTCIEQDRLNARIRTLELKAGMADPWK